MPLHNVSDTVRAKDCDDAGFSISCVWRAEVYTVYTADTVYTVYTANTVVQPSTFGHLMYSKTKGAISTTILRGTQDLSK